MSIREKDKLDLELMSYTDIAYEIIKEDNETLNVGSGILLSKLARVAGEEELTGIEFASGIPGSFGGAIYMNSGAYGNEIGDKIISSTYINENLEIKTITKKEQEFSYRKSIFQKKDWIIISAKIKLEKGNKEEIKNKIEEYSKNRKEKQPLNLPSAGSTFKRGTDFITAKLIDECGLKGYITAQLIDKCGLKGYGIGDAEVSNLHAGFIVNKGNATATDVLKLIQYIQEKIKEKFNVDIEPEIRILGVD